MIKKFLYLIGKPEKMKLFRKLYWKYSHGYYLWGMCAFFKDFIFSKFKKEKK